MERTYLDKNSLMIMSSGETLEQCFANAAHAMFSLMVDVQNIHGLQIITFEFTETDVAKALVTWLNTLLGKAKEHKLLLGDFRLKRTGDKWEATVAGDPKAEIQIQETDVKGVNPKQISVIKNDHIWEARCALLV